MITSPRNPKVAAAARLHKRAQRESQGRFLVEGAQVVGAALDSGAPLDQLFVRDASSKLASIALSAGVPVLEVGEEAMQRLTGTVTPQGLVGVCRFVDAEVSALPESMACAGVLCEGRDPGNAGTIVRSADAAGADAVVFAGSSVDPYNPKAVRASAGSLFHIPVARRASVAEAVEGLRARGMRIIATAADAEQELFDADLSGGVAFLFGNEAHGLSAQDRDLADAAVRIPILGRAESLNLANAAALCFYETARRSRPSLAYMVGGAAHDLRSPMAAVGNFAALLLSHGEGMSEEDRKAMLEGIVHDSRSADLIIRQLIDAARLTSGGLTLNMATVDVTEAVADLATEAGFDRDHPAIVWQGGEETLTADPARLRSCLAAAVEAMKWWAREGDVRVTGVPGGVVVERDGALEPPGGLEGLFVPRRPGTGSGSKIGLYVARGVAREHGGDVTIEDRDGTLRIALTF